MNEMKFVNVIRIIANNEYHYKLAKLMTKKLWQIKESYPEKHMIIDHDNGT